MAYVHNMSIISIRYIPNIETRKLGCVDVIAVIFQFGRALAGFEPTEDLKVHDRAPGETNQLYAGQLRQAFEMLRYFTSIIITGAL